MATWTDIPDGNLDPGQPIRSVDGLSLRDNPVAIAESANDAPIVRGGWHPYNQTTYGAGSGLIYDHGVMGNVTEVESPVFEDKYEYMFLWQALARTSGADANLNIEFQLVSTAAYTFTLNLGAIRAAGGARYNHGMAYIETPYRVANMHRLVTQVTVEATNPAANANFAAATGTSGRYTATRNQATAINRMKLVASAADAIQNGSVWLLKRRIEGLA